MEIIIVVVIVGIVLAGYFLENKKKTQTLKSKSTNSDCADFVDKWVNKTNYNKVEVDRGENRFEKTIGNKKYRFNVKPSMQNIRIAEYTSTRLSFRRREIDPLDMDDKIIIHVSNTTENITFEMTKQEFFTIFDNVVKGIPYNRDGNFNYPRIPSKALAFVKI
ncbi:MAG: hypothetical protein H8E55_71605 [Pelagibacterales bacterium]|nr:hypothetical protein [Pelagibacterales bacterium]